VVSRAKLPNFITHRYSSNVLPEHVGRGFKSRRVRVDDFQGMSHLMVNRPEGRASCVATVVSSVPQPAPTEQSNSPSQQQLWHKATQTPGFRGFLSTRLHELRTLHTFSEFLVQWRAFCWESVFGIATVLWDGRSGVRILALRHTTTPKDTWVPTRKKSPRGTRCRG